MANTFPATPVIVVIVILSLIILGLFIWALYNYNMLYQRSASINQNPYCLRVACPIGSTKQAYELTLEEDPQLQTYQTVNYCTVNAPPEQFQAEIANCANAAQNGWVPPVIDGDNGDFVQLFTKFLNWYPVSYIPGCGYSWKNQEIPTSLLAEEWELSSLPNPNGEQLGGINDVLVNYSIACAEYLGLTNEPGYQQLLDYVNSAPVLRQYSRSVAYPR